MDKKILKIILITGCILTVILFWQLRDKKVSFKKGHLASIAPLTEQDIGSSAINLQEAFVKVSERIRPAVVNISSVHTIETPHYQFFFEDPFEEFFEYFFDQPRTPRRKKSEKKRYEKRYESGGSGVIINSEGYILTNEHVIHEADEIKVKVNIDGKDKVYEGKVMGKDTRTDLAVVKISAGIKLPAAPLGDSDKIRVGEWVIAIGSPFGLESTVTSGIVSAVRQSITVEDRTYKDFIQTDAAINRGNSGGPLCNIKGEVIGINTAIYAPTGVFAGIGFAIPINRAKEILDDLIFKGKVVRGWLGVEINPVDDAIKNQFGLPDKNGALINNVLEKSPAQKAGLKRGDVIIEFDEKKISSPQELQSIVAGTPPKKKVKIKIIRDTKSIEIELATDEMPEEIAEVKPSKKQTTQETSWFGMKVSEITDELSERYRIDEDEKGVVVIDIDPSEKAYEIGILEGDLIKSINRKLIPDTEAFKEVTKNIKLKDGVVFDIVRQGKPVFISYTE